MPRWPWPWPGCPVWGSEASGRTAPAHTLPRADAWVRGPPARIRRRWGNQVSPSPCLRAQPSQTLSRAEVWGNPVSPRPHRMKNGCWWEGYALPNPPMGEVCSPQPSMRLAPHTDGMNIIPGRASPSQTLPGAGAWVRGPLARVRGGMGKPGFPIPLAEGVCSR